MEYIHSNTTQYRLHHRLAKYIIKVGYKVGNKKHGNYWQFDLDNCIYKLDDYSYAIHLNEFYVGMDFGGFSSQLSIDRYKYHIGKLYQYWLKNKSKATNKVNENDDKYSGYYMNNGVEIPKEVMKRAVESKRCNWVK